MSDSPITVAIERRIDPARASVATSWMQAGTDLAATFDGFLGSGWVRAGEASDLWYMLYRFRDIADPATGVVLYTVEHEVRSVTHPMFGRPLVNRNAAINNRNYVHGHEAWAWAMPPR